MSQVSGPGKIFQAIEVHTPNYYDRMLIDIIYGNSGCIQTDQRHLMFNFCLVSQQMESEDKR